MPCLTIPVSYYPTAKEEAATKEETKWYKNDFNRRPADRAIISSENDARDRLGERAPTSSEDFDALYAQFDEFLQIRKAVERSKSIQTLDNDWDDEGSEGYAASTWQRAASFVSAQASTARDSGLLIGVPTIAPADRGSIDIHWQNADCNLLINVPSELKKSATYYGANQRGETISGRLDTQNPRSDLLLWLTNRR